MRSAVALLLGALLLSARPCRAGLDASSTVFIIVMENHNWSEIKDSPSAPFINGTLLPMASYAEQYRNPPRLHPSEPNYLWLEAGTNFGITNNQPPSVNHQSTSAHLVTQLSDAGISWKTYQEDLPSGLSLPTEDRYPYTPRHNPFVFFDDVAEDSASIRPFTDFAADLAHGATGHYNFITPNLINDMHDAAPPFYNAVRQGDDWLARVVPMILQSETYRNNGLLIITWDEGSYGSSDGPIGMIVLSAHAKGGGYRNSVQYTHSSTLRTMQKIFGVGPLLAGAATAVDLSDLFAEGAIPNADSPIALKGVAWTAGGFTVDWQSQPGLKYQVQWSDQPGGGTWTTLPPVFTGTGEVLSLTDDGTQSGGFTAPERFYRVVVP